MRYKWLNEDMLASTKGTDELLAMIASRLDALYAASVDEDGWSIVDYLSEIDSSLKALVLLHTDSQAAQEFKDAFQKRAKFGKAQGNEMGFWWS